MMRRFIPKTLKQFLLALAPIALVVGWLTGFWTLGAGVALSSLCALAMLWTRPKKQTSSGEPETIEEPEPQLPTRRNENASLVEQMVAQGRVALLLRPQIASGLSPADLQAAQDALDDGMAMVPEGQVAMRGRCYEALNENDSGRAERLVHVEGLFLDRFTVTNRDYYEFVSGGGYEQMSLWDEAIWPAVLGFVDRTGQPGPRFWEKGKYARGTHDHPVVGVSWYEATAFARWAGKRLPTDAEWVKAASWPVFAEGGRPVQRRFPWGDAMDRRLANIWGSGHDATVPVRDLPGGASVNGVEQLVGNVWEWTSTPFGAWEPVNRKIETAMPLKSIRGGAFDTYFETQAHAQFQSGETPLARKHNIGFRCALGFCDVAHMSGDETDSKHPTRSAPAAEQTQPFELAFADQGEEVLA
jgi:gamma-glutamyl hercynylcysteine S-oxide synthase